MTDGATEAVRVCALGDCDRPAGSGGILCPEDKENLEATLFSRPAALAAAASAAAAERGDQRGPAGQED
ncbi:MAG TPA: hypothetical protein VGM53_35235 [Streptosporangiaceae bacterium]